jgi:hypothetical protein
MQPKLITDIPLTEEDLLVNAAVNMCINVGGMLLQVYTATDRPIVDELIPINLPE